ncbi:MAG: MYXO-CTERM sorting domain-containing protein, partial [Myxococcota bacterium]|nr:MYXO-CTERM sorting domain-containing protein [Myxococcota bacterium]
SDCRDGYVCYPSDSNPEMGMCWESCFTAGCEEGSFCNQYGLCGDEMPPLGEERPDNPVDEGVDEGGSAPVCACDTTWACSEGCECDPECIEVKNDDGGCNSAGTELWWFLVMLGALQFGLRRRRVLI